MHKSNGDDDADICVVQPEKDNSVSNVAVEDLPGKSHRQKLASRILTLRSHKGTSRRPVAICLSIVLYFALVILIYSTVEGWDVLECIYFAIVVVTTVGYGDYLPTTNGTKLATIFLCHFALAIVAFAIGHFLNELERWWLSFWKVHEDHNEGLLEVDATRRRRRNRSLLALLVYVCMLVIGTTVFALCLDWDEDYADDDDNRWVNGLYLTVITVTTIGFGDFSPYERPALQVFACFLMIFGIPSAVTVLALVTEMVFGELNHDVELRVVSSDMTDDKFDKITSFVEEELRADGIGNYQHQGKDQISRFEYFCFVLVRNKVITVKNVEAVMNSFDKIDRTKSGFIDVTDLSSHCDPHSAHEFSAAEKEVFLSLTSLHNSGVKADYLPGACNESIE